MKAYWLVSWVSVIAWESKGYAVTLRHFPLRPTKKAIRPQKMEGIEFFYTQQEKDSYADVATWDA
jgi:hypothetical protein